MRKDGLSERKRNILRRVINHYVREVHPVSSQRLAREINVSSATVRNELAALEEQGFLQQPHTSGGRIPTDLAYRFLVEELVNQVATTIDQRVKVADVYTQLGEEMELLLEGTLDLLTEMTGYMAWVSMPTNSLIAIKSINFVEVDSHELLLVLVTGTGMIQSRKLQFDIPVKELSIGRLTEALNNYLRGRLVTEVNYAEIRGIFRQSVDVPESLITSIEDFFSGLAGSGDRIMFSNALRLALEPEFARAESLNNVLHALEDRERFIRMLREQLIDRQVQSIIGTENKDADLHNCSLVLTRYAIPEGREGTVGVLGPTRLLYERTIPWVKVIGDAVAQALDKISADGEG
jgi:heat-inducible transcriptional repressor